jgi:transcriptional regulator with XRE-family HTH domain
MAPRRPAPSGPTVDQAFGRVLQQRLSQEALGLASGNGRTFVSQLERGERGASLKTIFRLALELNAKPSEIIRLVEIELGTATPTSL